MKFLPLYDLQHEINRLFIAGSKFAKNDPRLLKQAAVFNQLGEKSPVFKKIAEGIENLISAEAVDSPSKLMEISTLLYAILYTQGETVEEELPVTELAPVLQLNDVYTNKSHLALKHLIEALSLQKEGRLDEVKKAFTNNQFNDFRIYHLFDAALANRYAEFADYIETTVIPAIGNPIMPFLINNFSYEGETGDIRRFRILAKLNYRGIAEMVDEIFEGQSVALQVEAVKTLSNDSKNEDLLIKFAGDKQKAIRLAAYEALANLNTETAQHTLVELFVSDKKKQDAPELGEVLKIRLPAKFIPALLEKAKADFKKSLELEVFTNKKTVVNVFRNLYASIKPLLCNLNEDILAFYKEMFSNEKYHEVAGKAKSNASCCHLPDCIAESVIKSLENKEGFEDFRF
ncbi:MAG: HEAT repeat domain-containing protein [Prevotellaceae bacterium]|jgi:hypothetical protein|nr:HEAT repeat domain-containing protein [Prevotellaceae bacterium]